VISDEVLAQKSVELGRGQPKHDAWYVGAKVMSKLFGVKDEIEAKLEIKIHFDIYIPDNGMAYLFDGSEWVSTIHFEGWEEPRYQTGMDA
jgi:hypothetical protein